MSDRPASALPPADRDRLYAELANAISSAGEDRESLFLARLVLLLIERVADAEAAGDAIREALRELPQPSLSARSPPSD